MKPESIESVTVKPEPIKAISIRLDEVNTEALAYLRDQPGGFNLNSAVKRLILDAAISRGWTPTQAPSGKTKGVAKKVKAGNKLSVLQAIDAATEVAVAEDKPVEPQTIIEADTVSDTTPDPVVQVVPVVAQPLPSGQPVQQVADAAISEVQQEAPVVRNSGIETIAEVPKFSKDEMQKRIQAAREQERLVPESERLNWG